MWKQERGNYLEDLRITREAMVHHLCVLARAPVGAALAGLARVPQRPALSAFAWVVSESLIYFSADRGRKKNAPWK
jgi:hypothetical protein